MPTPIPTEQLLAALTAHKGVLCFKFYQPGQGGAFEMLPFGRASIENALLDLRAANVIELRECDLLEERYKFRRVTK